MLVLRKNGIFSTRNTNPQRKTKFLRTQSKFPQLNTATQSNEFRIKFRKWRENGDKTSKIEIKQQFQIGIESKMEIIYQSE